MEGPLATPPPPQQLSAKAGGRPAGRPAERQKEPEPQEDNSRAALPHCCDTAAAAGVQFISWRRPLWTHLLSVSQGNIFPPLPSADSCSHGTSAPLSGSPPPQQRNKIPSQRAMSAAAGDIFSKFKPIIDARSNNNGDFGKQGSVGFLSGHSESFGEDGVKAPLKVFFIYLFI